jgi:uncharacterized phage protein (TIGR01671 family)
MNREIKFRAWCKPENKMYYLDNINRVFVLSNDLSWDLGDASYEWEVDGAKYHPTIKEKNDVLMQYTGLKDKNGKEIYENDILKAHGIVKWNDKEYRWSAIDLSWNDKREWHDLDYLTSPFEIIGNIYENPELLK